MYTKEYPNPCPMGALICVIFCIYKPMPSLGHDILAEKSEKVRRYPLMRSFCCFFLFQDDEGFLLLFVLFLSDSTFAEIYTLSLLLYMFCFAISLEVFFTIQHHTLFYPILPHGEFRILKRNTHSKT